MAANSDKSNPFGDDDWLRDAMSRFLKGEQPFDPKELFGDGAPEITTEKLMKIFEDFGRSFESGGGLRPDALENHALTVAKEGEENLDDGAADEIAQAGSVATLWLDETTDIAPLTNNPTIGKRSDWVETTLPVWQAMAEPVSTAIPRAISQMMSEQVPEEVGLLWEGLGSTIEQISKNLFAVQLAITVGNLSREVLSGGDVGAPLVVGENEYDVKAFLIAQNMREFANELNLPPDQADIFLACREIAHARLFRHARWLRLEITSAISAFANGITIDGDQIMRVAEDLDPSDAESMRKLLASGALLPERTKDQRRALGRLETMLALIEGWVDHVSNISCSRLPKVESLSEAARRRRASGGPGERAFSTLVGLELRPRKLREASRLWEAIYREFGAGVRDALWSHPDRLPRAEDLDEPEEFLRQINKPNDGDGFDEELRELLESDDLEE